MRINLIGFLNFISFYDQRWVVDINSIIQVIFFHHFYCLFQLICTLNLSRCHLYGVVKIALQERPGLVVDKHIPLTICWHLLVAIALLVHMDVRVKARAQQKFVPRHYLNHELHILNFVYLEWNFMPCGVGTDPLPTVEGASDLHIAPARWNCRISWNLLEARWFLGTGPAEHIDVLGLFWLKMSFVTYCSDFVIEVYIISF